MERARRYAFYAQKPASAEKEREKGVDEEKERGPRRIRRRSGGGSLCRLSARTINYLLIPSKKPVQVRPSRHTDAITAGQMRTYTPTHPRPRGRCFIDTYDGTLSGWSCFKPQRDLTEKRHTFPCLYIYGCCSRVSLVCEQFGRQLRDHHLFSLSFFLSLLLLLFFF